MEKGSVKVTGYQPEPKLHCADQPKFDSLFNTIFTEFNRYTKVNIF